MNTDQTHNEFSFIEDEIAEKATSAKYDVEHRLVEQYKTVGDLKTTIQNYDGFDPIKLKTDVFSDDYNIFRMVCPKAWKAFMDVVNKRSMEYFEREK